MRRRRVALALLCAAVAASAPPALAGGPRVITPPAVPTSTSSFIDTLNYYRAAAGVQPVVENPAWTAGIEAHLKYLALTDPSLQTGAYASAHSENPASPYYTAAGDAEAHASNLGGGSGPSDAVEELLTAPFHGLGLLRAGLQSTAYGQRANAYGVSDGIDVLSGLGPAPAAQTWPALFPGPGTTVPNLGGLAGGELPNPYESCSFSTDPKLPVIVQLGPSATFDAMTTASLSGPGGLTMSTAAGNLCLVDGSTYVTTDPVYGPAGRSILGSNNGLLLTRQPLTTGTWTATLHFGDGHDLTWSFTVVPPPPHAATATLSVPNKAVVEGHTVHVTGKVLDQYGKPFAGGAVHLVVSVQATAATLSTLDLVSGPDGSYATDVLVTQDISIDANAAAGGEGRGVHVADAAAALSKRTVKKAGSAVLSVTGLRPQATVKVTERLRGRTVVLTSRKADRYGALSFTLRPKGSLGKGAATITVTGTDLHGRSFKGSLGLRVT